MLAENRKWRQSPLEGDDSGDGRSVGTAEVPELVPSGGASAGVGSLLKPLTPGVEPGGAGDGPAGATAFGGRFPGTLTVTRSRSISFPWAFWE